jgi:hypothetical protein
MIMGKDFLSDHHVVVGLVPAADRFTAGQSSDVIAMRDYQKCTFIVVTGAIEDAGISNLVTVEACDDVVPSTTAAVAFKRRTQLSSTTVDTWGALTAVATTGYNFAAANAVANAVWVAEVNAEDLGGYGFVRLKIAETADKTITACVIAILSNPRYPQAVPVTAIA